MKQFRYLLIVLFLFSLFVQPATVVSGEVNIPYSATITSATLSVYVYEVAGSTIDVHRVASNWSEDTVTWNSFAGAYDTAVIGSFTPMLAGWQTVDVKDTVQSWIDGRNPNYGFLLRIQPPLANDIWTVFHSSEYSEVALRPKLDICYTAPGISEECITIQRPSSEPVDVADAYIYSSAPGSNYGSDTKLYAGLRLPVDKDPMIEKHSLIYFDITVDNPDVEIIKYTNGEVASDPNGADVPRIAPGETVVWTYRVSNVGTVAVAREEVLVTDDQPGVAPEYDSEETGNGDDIFEPGEVWWYKATGIAVDLEAPPDGVKTYPGYCTMNGEEDPRTAYINQGTVTIPGDTDTAPSSYCNPRKPPYESYIYYMPMISKTRTSPYYTPFRLTVGYEDLPMDKGMNDYDYNDWIVDIVGTGTFESAFSDRFSSIDFTFAPNGRGATLRHAFHVVFPASTFASSGTYTLTTYDANHLVVSTQTGAFDAARSMNFNIFPDTGVVFPANFSNTFEDRQMVKAQRTAELRLTFNVPIVFNFSDYDYTMPHGAGLFFDPYIAVLGTTREIHSHDLRMLNVPEIQFDSPIIPYEWPEEWVRIDKAYPDLTFIPANPPTRPLPDIIFPDGWWLTNNNCVIDDVPCHLTDVRPTNPLDFSTFSE